ncbi:WD repeat-containing protein on Y chromosome [Lampris incognitus]|uniref:WD repeat-containing protein on Y chromosome n=1 Tax=Lampris incognitus TaxID=2546036 RepID=UPI0024B56411|nr:WD repeat-containing protein on Y chromosome [Lampris incognitus]
MPFGEKARPSTASGRLEAAHVASIISELGSIGERREDTSTPRCRGEKARLVGNSADRKPPPAWLEREQLKQSRRRHSFTLGDEAQLTARRYPNADSVQSLQLDEKVSLDSLQKLKRAFEELEMGGSRSLDVKNFACTVKRCLGLRHATTAQIQELFMKIDYSGQGGIAWDQFCTYMQLEYTEKEESVLRRKQVAFSLPATVKALCHGDPVLGIHPFANGTIVTVREDGTVCYWSPELQVQKTKRVFHERPVNRKPKTATDFIPMTQYNKLIIGTWDREIQLYELSSLEPCCQISALETVPLTLDYCYTGPDECSILYGDTQGCVNIIILSSVGEMLRLWKKLTKIENMPNLGLENAILSPNVTFVRWKIHQERVTQVKYFQTLPAVASSSNEEASALAMGCLFPSMNIEQQMKELQEVPHEGKAKKVQLNMTPQPRAPCDQTVFVIYKGVKTFDLCKKHNLLVTGGMDRLVRLWNPYVPGKPTGILKGHPAPIFYLCISPEDSQIFSVSTDNTIKIWDIDDQCCLFTAHPKDSLIHGDVSACLYSPSMKALYVAADAMALLSLKIRRQQHGRRTVSHSEPVMCCGYSEAFRRVVSCTEGSVVKVWEFDTGCQVFEFGEAHGLSAITCMTFDLKGRRLITGGRDGCLKIWNFNNGQCLKVLKRDGERHEVCDCSYLKVHRNVYVLSVGWDRKIDIYSDTPEDTRHVQRPQPSWQDDQKNGHNDDILCIAQCPPSLLATSSYDGEIIVWNVVSGHIQCRLLTPVPPEYQNTQGVDTSVPCVIFLKNCSSTKEVATASGLLSSGVKGYVNFWHVLNGGKFVSSFEASTFQQRITKVAITAGEDTLMYAADQIGYIYVYNMKTFANNPQKKPPREHYWRAHTSRITGLQIVDSDQVLLTSSTDCTVRLWSTYGEFIGTFGQSDSWSIHITSSWKHPTVPYEILIDPLSMSAHEILNEKTRSTDATTPDKIEVDKERRAVGMTC